MRPFRMDEAALFFGRDRETSEILNRLLENRFVAVIGAEGSGKTSVINCGVIPALMKTPGTWRFMTLCPGKDPIGSLAAEMVKLAVEKKKDAGPALNLEDTLKKNPGSLSRIAESMLEGDEKLLIIVDQFEQIFRFSQAGTGSVPEEEYQAFVNLLLNCIIGDKGRIYLAVVISSQWISDCTRFPNFAEAVIISRSSVIIPGLTGDNLENIILRPLTLYGIKAEPELTARLVKEAAAFSEKLPVIQNTLRKMLINRPENEDPFEPLSVKDFEETGTFSGSVEKHAEEIFSGLDRNEKYLCEKIFRSLIVKGPRGEYLRKRCTFGHIIDVAGCSREKLAEVVEKLSDNNANLIYYHGDLSTNLNTVIDIRYNILPEYWSRLRKWADEEDNSVRTYKQLAALASFCHQGKTGLLKQPELRQFSEWAAREKPVLQWAVTHDPAFERAMVYLRASEKHFKEEEEKRERLKKIKSKKRRLFGLGIAAGFIFILGMLGIFIAGKIRADNALAEAEIMQDKSDSISLVLLRDFLAADSLAKNAKRYGEDALRQKETEFSLRMQAVARAEKERMLRKNTEAVADSIRSELAESRESELKALQQKQEEARK
ncbi:MAG: ATP-binding protein, partial [Bacteroidales bacterium]|nr:ATP-binding protein [Bacteroidales bacterium]